MAVEVKFETIFEDFEENLGTHCFANTANTETLKTVKRSIHRLLSSYGNYRVIVKKVIKGAANFYKERKKQNQNLARCLQEDLSAVGALTLTLHLYQHFNITDETDEVKELMMNVYQEDGGFDRFCLFLDPLVFPYEVDPILFPQKREQVLGMVPEYLTVLEYFLSQAHDLKVRIEYSELDLTQQTLPVQTYESDVRFIDAPLPASRGSTPLLLACHATHPESVLMLLRYGADALRSGQVHRVIGIQFQHPLYVLLTKLNASVFWLAHHQHLDVALNEQFMKTHNRQVEDIRLCLRYFSRAVVNLPISIAGESNTFKESVGKVFYLHPKHSDAVPNARTTEPAELCHLARCAVRKQLLQHSQLDMPSSVQKLPLPSLLKEYMDLRID